MPKRFAEFPVQRLVKKLIAVIVPAHNEEECIGRCVSSLLVAARCPDLAGEDVNLIIVLDSCTDGTRQIASELGVTIVELSARNVGAARSAGATFAMELGARWLAFTDADTEVDEYWLAAQLAQRCDAVCGTVAIRDWGGYDQRMICHFANTYFDCDGHRHVHGANLGVSAEAYVRAGGFENLVTSEDVTLVNALRDSGARISWSAAPRVFTSARRDFKAPGGFGATLNRIDLDESWFVPPIPGEHAERSSGRNDLLIQPTASL